MSIKKTRMQQSGLKMAGENLMYLSDFQERKHFLIVDVVGRVEIMI